MQIVTQKHSKIFLSFHYQYQYQMQFLIIDMFHISDMHMSIAMKTEADK